MNVPNDSRSTVNANTRSPSEQKDLSRGASIDMSSEAVTRRLDLVDELRELAAELASAKRLGPVTKP
jgi:hypothetical protein